MRKLEEGGGSGLIKKKLKVKMYKVWITLEGDQGGMSLHCFTVRQRRQAERLSELLQHSPLTPVEVVRGRRWKVKVQLSPCLVSELLNNVYVTNNFELDGLQLCLTRSCLGAQSGSALLSARLEVTDIFITNDI